MIKDSESFKYRKVPLSYIKIKLKEDNYKMKQKEKEQIEKEVNFLSSKRNIEIFTDYENPHFSIQVKIINDAGYDFVSFEQLGTDKKVIISLNMMKDIIEFIQE